ncbi:MAG: DUF1295 domain-containing protein, partial [Gammaproteobacteria bacterium]|nr:DUF1295 domain-containing protein [Gammaproteobacteria bacterium]
MIALALGALIAFAGSQGGMMHEQWPLFALCVAIAFAIQWLAFVPSFIFQTEHYYDVTGSFTYLTVIGCALYFGDTSDPRTVLIAILCSLWAVRLGSFLFKRIRQDGSD